MTQPSPHQLAIPLAENARFSLNGVEYVIVRSEVFDSFKELLDADHEELRLRLRQSFADNGWDEPGMEAYDSYPEKP